MQQEQRSVYDTEGFFERYQQLRQNPKSFNEIVEKPTMLSLLPDLTNKTVLDLACGTGEHLALYLSNQANSVIGIDLSKEMLKQAEKNLKNINPNKNNFILLQSPLENLANIILEPVDIITSSFAFHYIEDFTTLLNDISQKLKPNGYLIFSQEHPIVTCYQGGDRWEKDKNKQQIAYRLNFYRDEGERQRLWFKQPFKTYHRTSATIINQLINAGFQIEQVLEPMLTDQPKWQNEFKDLQHRPMILVIKASKKI